MKPTIGRVVIYKPNDQDRTALTNHPDGYNNTQKELPAIIVAVWGDSETASVNLKVMVDGNHRGLWITSVQRGDAEGQWNWPAIVQ